MEELEGAEGARRGRRLRGHSSKWCQSLDVMGTCVRSDSHIWTRLGGFSLKSVPRVWPAACLLCLSKGFPDLNIRNLIQPFVADFVANMLAAAQQKQKQALAAAEKLSEDRAGLTSSGVGAGSPAKGVEPLSSISPPPLGPLYISCTPPKRVVPPGDSQSTGSGRRSKASRMMEELEGVEEEEDDSDETRQSGAKVCM